MTEDEKRQNAERVLLEIDSNSDDLHKHANIVGICRQFNLPGDVRSGVTNALKAQDSITVRSMGMVQITKAGASRAAELRSSVKSGRISVAEERPSSVLPSMTARCHSSRRPKDGCSLATTVEPPMSP